MLIYTKPALCNPYFYIDGDQSIGAGNNLWHLKVDTDGQTIGALQTSVVFDAEYFETVQINTQNSICNIWSAADAVPPGENITRTTPYFTADKIVASCGIPGAGYNGDSGLILSFTLKPILDGDTVFSHAHSKFAYQGSSVSAGAESNFLVSIFNSGGDPDVTPRPTPTKAPNSATASARINTRTLFSDVEFQQWNPNTRSQSSGTTTAGAGNVTDLEEVPLDNTVPPPPPDMTPRPKKQPKTLAELLNMQPATESGEVKAIQSLRDLLIPGKSEADKTVVIVNFISTITFLIILAIILWRMILNSRTNKLKSEYINELITGELSALESKMEIVGEKAGKDRFEQEFEKSVQHILEEMNPQKEKVKEK